MREQAHAKFYWFDAGVARATAGLLGDPADRVWQGYALETLIFHELRVFNETSGRHRPIGYYATPAGTEVDFVVETRSGRVGRAPHVVCLEVRLASKWDPRWERAMRDLAARGGIGVDRMIGVYLGPRAYYYDGIDVQPLDMFLRELFASDVF